MIDFSLRVLIGRFWRRQTALIRWYHDVGMYGDKDWKDPSHRVRAAELYSYANCGLGCAYSLLLNDYGLQPCVQRCGDRASLGDKINLRTNRPRKGHTFETAFGSRKSSRLRVRIIVR